MKIKLHDQQRYFPEERLLSEIIGKNRISIGIPKENSEIETRLGLTPEGVALIVEEGHLVYIQRGAGLPMSYSDLQYSEAGAILLDDAKEVFQTDIVLKITPPTVEEIGLMKNKSTVFSMLQLSALSKAAIELLIEKKMTAIVYDLIKDRQKAFPVTNSIAEIEGVSAIAVAAELLTSERGGKGILLGGIAGIPPTEVLILGAGIASSAAAQTALAIGAEVKVFDHDVNKLRKIKQHLGQHVFTSVIHPTVLFKALSSADAVIGNLRYINDSERFMVSEDLVKTMKKGAVIIDLSVGQGGCFESSEAGTISRPLFEKHGVLHYCVPNISARVARTSSMALSNIFTPILLKIGASGGVREAIAESSGFRNGVFVYEGTPVNRLISAYYGFSHNNIELLIAGF